MSLFISSYDPGSSRNSDQDVEEQQRRKEREIRLRRRADRQTMENYLETRKQDVAVQIHEGMKDASSGLLHAVLHDELRHVRERATEDAASAAPTPQDSPREAPREKSTGGTDTSPPVRPRQPVPVRVNPPASRTPVLSGVMTRDAAAIVQASVSKALHDDDVVPGSAHVAKFAESLDRMLSELQSHVAEGGSTIDRLFSMFEVLNRSSSGMDAGAIDEDNARRIDGACRFLSAYIDSMDCRDSERSGLIRKLDESWRVVREPQQFSASQAGSIDDARADPSPKAQPEMDRQTLYAYLELLKSLANPPRDGGEARQLAARLAEMRTADPSAALKRLAESGDQSVSLYVQEISRQLQRIDAREKRTRASGLSGSLGEWLDSERKSMQAAIRHVEDISSYAYLKRTHDEASELKQRAETMPLVILQKA